MGLQVVQVPAAPKVTVITPPQPVTNLTVTKSIWDRAGQETYNPQASVVPTVQKTSSPMDSKPQTSIWDRASSVATPVKSAINPQNTTPISSVLQPSAPTSIWERSASLPVTGVNGTPTPKQPMQYNEQGTGLKEQVGGYLDKILPRRNIAEKTLTGTTKFVADILTTIGTPVYDAVQEYYSQKQLPTKILGGQSSDLSTPSSLEPDSLRKERAIRDKSLPVYTDVNGVSRTVLNDLPIINKTPLQIGGDIGQSIMMVYAPELGGELLAAGFSKAAAGQALKKIFLQGAIKGAVDFGLPFGVAQGLSSGTKDPKEFSKIVLENVAYAGLLGGALDTALPALGRAGVYAKKVNDQVAMIREGVEKDLISRGYTPEQAKTLAFQQGSIKNPFAKSSEENYGSISKTSDGKFVAYDPVRKERLYEPGKGVKIRIFDTEAEAQQVLNKLRDSRIPTSRPLGSSVSPKISKNEAEALKPESTPQLKYQEKKPTEASSFEAKYPTLLDDSYKPKVNDVTPTVKQEVKQLSRAERSAIAELPKLQPGDGADKLGVFMRARNAADSLWTSFRNEFQDDWIRVKRLIDKPETITPKTANPYEAEILSHGRIQARTEQVLKTVDNIDKDILKSAKKFNISDKQLTSDINNYLVAKHAPERNLEHGDGAAGISTAAANKRVAEIESSKHGEEVIRIAKQVKVLSDQTLDVLLESGLIKKETYTLLKDIYKNHVPLNRVMQGDEFTQVLTSRGLDVKSSGLVRAKGSSKEVADILTNTVANLEKAIIRSEKNRIDLATLNFARANKESGLFTELHTKPTGDNPSILSLFENGKHRYLKINDSNLAVVLKGLNREKIPGMLKFVGTFTRFLSSMSTRFNPEFWLPNKIRDLQEMVMDIAARKNMGFKAAGKSVVRDPASMLDVLNFHRGNMTEGAKLYDQMRMDGGTTGGMSLSTRADVEVSIDKIRSLNRSKPKQVAEYILNKIDETNGIVEDSTRLSVYKTALEKGISRPEAARMAKEASINFNKMGKGGPIINALYMFSNASIQGSTKMLRAMRNPKVAATVILGTAGSVFAINEYNDTVDPEWKTKVSKYDRYNNINIVLHTDQGIKYLKIPVSWGIKPIKVASEYAYDLATNSKTNVSDAAQGILSSVLDGYNPLGGTDIMSAISPTILDTPLDISRNRSWTGSMIKPDFPTNGAESARYFDSLLKTETGKVAAKGTELLYGATGGRVDLSPADVIYAYQQYTGGLGRATEKFVNTVTEIGKGKVPELQNVPIASRFYNAKTQEEVQSNSGLYKDLKAADTIVSERSSISARNAKNYFNEMMALPKNQRTTYIKGLVDDKKFTPEVAKYFINTAKDKAKGYDSFEKAFSTVSVEARGKFLYDELVKLPVEDRQGLVERLASKKLLTPAVLQALAVEAKRNKK